MNTLDKQQTLTGVLVQPVVGRLDEPIDLYCEHAKEKANLPSNWRVFKWECFPKSPDETIYVAVTGAVCEHMKPNADAGRDWKRRCKSTERTINLVLTEHKAWKAQWEVRTNKCSECTGTGETFASWSVRDGIKMRTCHKCKGAKTPNDPSSPTAGQECKRAEKHKSAQGAPASIL